MIPRVGIRFEQVLDNNRMDTKSNEALVYHRPFAPGTLAYFVRKWIEKAVLECRGL